MPCIWSSVFLTTTSCGLFVNSSKCASNWHWYITDAKISERRKHKDIFFIQMENITDLWGSDNNSYSVISSYNKYLYMPPFTKFYDLKTYSKELFSCWLKMYSGVGVGMGLVAWTIWLWLFTYWISTAFQWPLTEP